MQSPRNVVVKVTNGCNLACRYCYAGASGSTVMGNHVLERMIEQFAALGKGTTHFIWHGGEPWSAGLPFYETALYLQYWHSKLTGHRFVNSVQTNGTLVTEKVVRFSERHGITMGFSLDGPCEVQGRMRPFADGRNSFPAVVRGMELARAHHLGGTGAILVLNSYTLARLNAIYEFFKEQRLSLKINPLIKAGRAELDRGLGITPDEYASAMISLFDRYVTECPEIRIEPFDMMLGNIALGENQGVCTFQDNCQHGYMSVTQDGDVYPCARFDGDTGMRFGNICGDSLSAILHSEVRHRLLERNSALDPACSRCSYLKSCYGGCMNNGFMRRRDPSDRDYYCSGYKRLFKHVDDFIRTQTNNTLAARSEGSLGTLGG